MPGGASCQFSASPMRVRSGLYLIVMLEPAPAPLTASFLPDGSFHSSTLPLAMAAGKWSCRASLLLAAGVMVTVLPLAARLRNSSRPIPVREIASRCAAVFPTKSGGPLMMITSYSYPTDLTEFPNTLLLFAIGARSLLPTPRSSSDRATQGWRAACQSLQGLADPGRRHVLSIQCGRHLP